MLVTVARRRVKIGMGGEVLLLPYFSADCGSRGSGKPENKRFPAEGSPRLRRCSERTVASTVPSSHAMWSDPDIRLVLILVTA